MHCSQLLILFVFKFNSLSAEQTSSSDYQRTLVQQEIPSKISVGENQRQEQEQLSSLSRIAPILGESSIVDKESGRVFWQGGKQSLFHSTVGHSYLSSREGILRHVRATILSCIIWISAIRNIAEWLLNHPSLALENVIDKLMAVSTLKKIGNIARRIARILLVCLAFLPTFNRMFVITIIGLYLLESYSCSTRKFLDNSLSSPEEIQVYMESLRQHEPCIKWEIRCFHHEKRKWISRLLLVDLMNWTRQVIGGTDENNNPIYKPILLTKKVITNRATDHYKLASWKDETVAGIWKRASGTTYAVAPFTKIALSKLVLFKNAKAKRDYFDQKSQFVNEEGKKDEFAEFSTSIEVQGYRPKLLAVKNGNHLKYRIEMFWLYTLLGLTVPFRIKFASQCDELRVTAVKEISVEIQREKAEAAPAFSMPSWLTPKAWFNGPNLSENIKQKGESFRKQMEELLLYDTIVDGDNVVETSVPVPQIVDIPTQHNSNLNGTQVVANATSILETTTSGDKERVNSTGIQGNDSYSSLQADGDADTARVN